MFIENQSQFAQAMLADRLKQMFGHIDVGNGTPVADALATALALDMRISGRADGPAVIDALDRSEIVMLACHLLSAVKTPNYAFELPLGTTVRTDRVADITVGGEHWILDAGRPGLHPMEASRRDAHGPNLELLLTLIERFTRKLACRRIGLPTPVHIVDMDDRHLLHFPPCAEAGGVVLQSWANGTHAPRFGAALPEQVREFAKSIVADMRLLWKRRKDIAARAAFVRELAEEQAAEHGAKVQLVAIDLSPQHDTNNFDMYVHYLAVDEAMRPGPVLDFIPDRKHITRDFYSAPLGVTYRPGELAELRAAGAEGWIDDMALAVARAAPGGVNAVSAKLANGYEALVELPTSGAPMFATLYWRDGTIKAEITVARKLDWCRNQLEIHDVSLPETMIGGLGGRTVDCIVTLPFACPLVIEEAHSMNTGVRLELKVEKRMVNLSTGRIWETSEAS